MKSGHQALFAILAQRCWQAISGAVTVLMITTFLDVHEQGWYFGLLSLAALYTIFDMGLSLVLVQAAAHEFIGLSWLKNGHIHGPRARRFEALAAWAIRHYAWLALAFGLIVTPFGFWFFSAAPSKGPAWQMPWVILTAINAASLVLLPFLSLVEGSGGIREVYLVRLLQTVAGALLCWIALAGGLGLWAVVMPASAGIVVQGIWLWQRKSRLVRSALATQIGPINWRREIWPHQWQIAVSWLCGYMLTQLYIPLLFAVQGAAVAGQMGLSLTLSNMLGLLALSWITRHVPDMANAVAGGDLDRFRTLCRRDLILSCLAFLGGAAVLCIVHELAPSHYTDRVLPFWTFAGLLLSGFLGHIQTSLATQLRSFRREPLVWILLAGSTLTAAGAAWGAVHYSSGGVVAAMLCVQLFLSTPASILLYRRCIDRWRQGLSAPFPVPERH
ncbi:hypothetical protein [Rhodopseudomonas sp.]|uniref:hypothetical protein n=1 Tax=Rhodopseudomonas sp. TaxID=1078 RepID=UPI0039E486BE